MNALEKYEDSYRRQRRRAELLEELRTGHMQQSEAMAMVEAEGLQYLVEPPNLDAYDAWKLPNWSLFMAWSWVTFRRPEPVQSAYNEYYVQLFQWRRNGLGGTEPQHNQPRSLHRLLRPDNREGLRATIDAEETATKDAWQLLKSAFLGKQIQVWGRYVYGATDKPVAPVDWHYWSSVDIGQEFHPLGLGNDALVFRDQSVVFVEPFVLREEVVAAFPEPKNASSKPMATVPHSEETTNAWPTPESFNLSSLEQSILAALRSHFPEGLPLYPSKTARDKAIWELVEKPKTANLKQPDPVTFRRFFQKIGRS